jgi:hypothetical protein
MYLDDARGEGKGIIHFFLLKGEASVCEPELSQGYFHLIRDQYIRLRKEEEGRGRKRKEEEGRGSSRTRGSRKKKRRKKRKGRGRIRPIWGIWGGGDERRRKTERDRE